MLQDYNFAHSCIRVMSPFCTVNDLEAFYDDHKEQGYKVGEIHSLTEGSSGLYFVTDPDGFEIELIQK